MNLFSDDNCDEIWKSIKNIEFLKTNNISQSMKDMVAKSVYDALENCVWDITYTEPEKLGKFIKTFGYDNHNLEPAKPNIDTYVYRNNIENIKRNISLHIWEICDPANIDDDFMLCSSINQNVGKESTAHNYNWFPFYDFVSGLGILSDKLFDFVKGLLLNGVYNFDWRNQFCFINALPVKITRDEQNQYHNLQGAAIEFKDGYKIYCINGRHYPAWIWEKAAKNEITKDLFVKEKNVEIKAAIYSVLGEEKIMKILGAVEVDSQIILHKNGDMEEIVLLKSRQKFKEIGNQPFAWVKMVCPSTGRTYLQGVEPKYTNAAEAIASLSPFKKSEYSFNFRS